MPAIHNNTKSTKIWWSNGIFFVVTHVAAVMGSCQQWRSVHPVSRASIALCIIIWQIASMGVTIGYHRLYSHRAFRAGFGVRLFLSIIGASAFQGSIKWWCLRHRLHHRFTDDPEHDPYSATRGLFWSHMGWIFYKPSYERLVLVDRDDLDSDPVVRFQHKYYVPLALITGFIIPPVIGLLWGDPLGAFIWAGLVARLLIWHCTFLVNSLAHWEGLQPYSDENTSKTNLLLALLTCGEGNHNFHAFPHDFRAGPAVSEWDPSKWVILIMYHLGLATSLRRARKEDVAEARAYMIHKTQPNAIQNEENTEWAGEVWVEAQIREYMSSRKGCCMILLDGYMVDLTRYLGEHPGGAAILRKYAIDDGDAAGWKDASWAFGGGLNRHSRAANKRMREMRVAKLREELTKHDSNDQYSSTTQ